MNLNNFITYLGAIAVVIAVPGPLSLFMVSNTLRYGLLKSWPGFIGGVLASICLLSISALGVGALVLASPRLFLFIEQMGALYLIYLGYVAWNEVVPSGEAHSTAADTPKFSALFSKAFLLGISNPKDIAFFVALLPAFIETATPIPVQLAWMIAGWFFVDMACKICYGLMAKSFFKKMAKIRWYFLKISALLFVGLGAMILVTSAPKLMTLF